jgi:hypothetical protein
MARTHVLRVFRTDDPSAHLLLNVTQTSDTRPLDLKLVATEHEHLYHGSVKHNNVAALRASNYTGDDDGLRQALAYTLLQERAAANLNALKGLEIVAAVSGETCTLSLRRKFGDVVGERLGYIILNRDDEREEVSAFDWVETAVASSDALRSELATLQASLVSQHAQVANLTSQLDELVKAKKEHEEQLLRKCAALLDTKRAKIRDQQREINATKTQGHKAGNSSRGKRDVSALDVDSGNEDADADANDDGDEEDDDEEEGQQTPEQETEDEGSDGGFAAPPKTVSTKNPVSTTAARQGRGKETAGEAQGKDGTATEVDLPPRRELPFARRAPQKGEGRGLRSTRSSAPPPAEEEEEEDDDTDDEL